MADSYTDAQDKAADETAMKELVALAKTATGTFADEATEQMNVHIGGRTAEYVPRQRSQSVERDPILAHVRDSDALQIRRVATKTFAHADETRPALTVEVADA